MKTVAFQWNHIQCNSWIRPSEPHMYVPYHKCTLKKAQYPANISHLLGSLLLCNMDVDNTYQYTFTYTIGRHSLTTLTKFWPIIDHLPTPGWQWWRNSFSFIWENLHTVDISSTTYLPCLVNVIKERPPCSLNLRL